MRWRKLGKIFDPSEFKLPNNCKEFAKSPQVLLFDDFIRIYFSSCALDSNGKYLSHIAFVDMTKDFQVINVCSKPVLPLGKMGCFDEHGIFPMNVLRVGDLIYGYTSGWSRRVSVSIETSIGLVVSNDGGLTFHRLGDGPILTSSAHEPYLVVDGFVKIYGGIFHMWYIFGTAWKKYQETQPPERTYKIGHAVSKDGISWTKEEGRRIIPDKLGDDECQALPSVIDLKGIYHMFFCYRKPLNFRKDKNFSYKIGHAYSTDLLNWTRADNDPAFEGTPGEWDSDMQCYPHVFEMDGRVFMLYNGNDFGRYGFGLAELEM